MSTVLTNGIIIPDNGSRNWGGDLANNWNILDVNVGYMNDVKNSVATLENSVAENTANIQTNASNISALQTSKQDNLSEQQIANIADVTNKANDADVVHKSGNETIGGVKTFSKISLKSSRIERGSLPASNITEDSEIEIVDKNNRLILGIFNYYYTSGSGRTSLYAYNPNTTDYDNLSISFDFDNTNNQKSLMPIANNVNLGTSTNKWKTLNGVNPGALSLPSMSFISLDTTGFNVTAAIIGTFTSTIDGWAILSMSQRNTPFGIWILQGSYRVTFQSVCHQGDYVIFALIPVRANVNMTIYSTANDIDSTRKVDWLRLFPCQGNV